MHLTTLSRLRPQIVAVVTLCRRCCCKSAVNYTPVNHGLDEEEMAFKKSMEAQHHGDDIDELFNFSGQDELDFDTNDLDDLEMLQVRLRDFESLIIATTKKLALGASDFQAGSFVQRTAGQIKNPVDDLAMKSQLYPCDRVFVFDVTPFNSILASIT